MVSEKEMNQELPARIVYVNNPNNEDTLCISEIKKAQKDIAQGKIFFTFRFGIGSLGLRYKNELKQLCKQNGLEFKKIPFGCISYEGQTQGCYCDYMDKKIIEKYGLDFKENLCKKADKLFLENADLNNKVVASGYCDERPRLPSQKKRKSDYLTTIIVKDLDIKKTKYDDWPFIDVGFIINKDSTIEEFDRTNYDPRFYKEDKLKPILSDIAIEHIKKNYPIWVPGKINGVRLRTHNSVRIYFKKE
jgi:hypothetical protein